MNSHYFSKVMLYITHYIALFNVHYTLHYFGKCNVLLTGHYALPLPQACTKVTLRETEKTPHKMSSQDKTPQEKTPQKSPVEKTPHPILGLVEKTPHVIFRLVEKTPQLKKPSFFI